MSCGLAKFIVWAGSSYTITILISEHRCAICWTGIPCRLLIGLIITTVSIGVEHEGHCIDRCLANSMGILPEPFNRTFIFAVQSIFLSVLELDTHSRYLRIRLKQSC